MLVVYICAALKISTGTPASRGPSATAGILVFTTDPSKYRVRRLQYKWGWTVNRPETNFCANVRSWFNFSLARLLQQYVCVCALQRAVSFVRHATATMASATDKVSALPTPTTTKTASCAKVITLFHYFLFRLVVLRSPYYIFIIILT